MLDFYEFRFNSQSYNSPSIKSNLYSVLPHASRFLDAFRDTDRGEHDAATTTVVGFTDDTGITVAFDDAFN